MTTSGTGNHPRSFEKLQARNIHEQSAMADELGAGARQSVRDGPEHFPELIVAVALISPGVR